MYTFTAMASTFLGLRKARGKRGRQSQASLRCPNLQPLVLPAELSSPTKANFYQAQMTTTMDYCYVPLDLSSQCIRLVELQPATNSSIVECKVYTVSLTDYPSYAAVSYTWGSLKNVIPILLSGKQFCVHENLWSFLDTMRRHTGYRRF